MTRLRKAPCTPPQIPRRAWVRPRTSGDEDGIGADPTDALERGRQSGLFAFRRYQEGAMQERGTARLPLTLGDDAAEWGILGSYQDCRERLERCREESGLTHVTCQFHDLPEDRSARLEYLEGFGAEVIQKLTG